MLLKFLTRSAPAFCLLSLFLGGCSPNKSSKGALEAAVPPSTIFASHSPAHPDTNAPVTIQARADGNVDKIILSYEVYTLSTSGNGQHVQTLSTPRTVVRTCDPAAVVQTLSCAFQVAAGFPAARLIKFFAEATNSGGKTTVESYAFAAGAYPWPTEAIPVRVTGSTVARMDVVFIPDTDIPVPTFRTSLVSVINDLYFKYAAYRGSGTENWRVLYNFYYSGVQGNYEETCQFTPPTNLATLRAVGDAVAILHQASLRDCKSGGMFSSEVNYDKTLIHESGHALFNLMDEYCCDSSYAQQSCVPNLYASLAACKADAPNLGLNANQCTQLTSGGQSRAFWRIDSTTGPGCMMGEAQHTAASDHGAADRRRIAWRRAKCLNGRCFTTPECP